MHDGNGRKAFEWYNEEVLRDLRRRYRAVRFSVSWSDFYLAWMEQVEKDAMRLRDGSTSLDQTRVPTIIYE
jgi:hypothetical protein